MKAAQFEQMMQLPAINPAEGHFANILGENLSVGANFSVAPQIAANLVHMVEAGVQHLADVPAPSHRIGAGMASSPDLVVNQQIETRIEEVKREPAIVVKMVAHGCQRFFLQIDRH